MLCFQRAEVWTSRYRADNEKKISRFSWIEVRSFRIQNRPLPLVRLIAVEGKSRRGRVFDLLRLPERESRVGGADLGLRQP
jgi:hypothetical protein